MSLIPSGELKGDKPQQHKITIGSINESNSLRGVESIFRAEAYCRLLSVSMSLIPSGELKGMLPVA